MAGKKRAGRNTHRKDKYKAHPMIAAANKVRRMKKHVKSHPNDAQTAAKVN